MQTTALCPKKGENDIFRNGIKEEYGFNAEYDVSASILRMTKSLNEGHWVDESISIYDLIAEQLDEPITKEEIKPLALRLYFDRPEQMTNHLLRNNREEYEEAERMLFKLRNAMQKVIGRFYDNEIFLVESCVYLDVLSELLKDGLAWMVYDCWYFSTKRKDWEERTKKLVEECFTRFYQEKWKTKKI